MTNGKIVIGESQTIEACFCSHCLELRQQQDRLEEHRKSQLLKFTRNDQIN